MFDEVFHSLVYEPVVFWIGALCFIGLFYILFNINLFLSNKFKKTFLPSLIISGVFVALGILLTVLAGANCSGESCLGIIFLIFWIPVIIIINFIIQLIATKIYIRFKANYLTIFKFILLFTIVSLVVLSAIGFLYKSFYQYPRTDHREWSKMAALANDPSICLDKVRPEDTIITCLNTASVISGSENFCKQMDKVAENFVPPTDNCLANLGMIKEYMKSECNTDLYDVNCLKQICREVGSGYCNMGYALKFKATRDQNSSLCDKISGLEFNVDFKKECYLKAGSNSKI